MIMMNSILYDVDDGDACVDNDADDDRRWIEVSEYWRNQHNRVPTTYEVMNQNTASTWRSSLV